MIVGLVLLMLSVRWFRLYPTSKNTSLKEVDMQLNRGNAEKWNFTWRFCLNYIAFVSPYLSLSDPFKYTELVKLILSAAHASDYRVL